MAALFPLGLGLPSRQIIFMFTPPFTMLLASNPQFPIPNMPFFFSQVLFHRLHLRRDSVLTLSLFPDQKQNKHYLFF
jgi:hypothetical protein